MNQLERAKLFDQVTLAEHVSIDALAQAFVQNRAKQSLGTIDHFFKIHVFKDCLQCQYPAEVLMLVKRASAGKYKALWHSTLPDGYTIAVKLLDGLERLDAFVETLPEQERFSMLLELRKLYIQWILDRIVGYTLTVR